MSFMDSFTWIALLAAILTLKKMYNIWGWSWVHREHIKRIITRGSTILIPTPPGAWPIIGHLPLLAGKTALHRTLATLSDRCGPVFSVRLGMKPAIIVSSKEAAKECFTTNDHVLASRPKSSLGKHMCHDYAVFGLSPYGPYWRQMRKIAVVELLSSLKVEQFGPLRASEIAKFIRELYSHISPVNDSHVVVNMGEWLRHLVINIIMKMVSGKRYSYMGGGQESEEDDKEVRRVIGVIEEFMNAAGLIVVSDLVPIPLLERLDIQGHVRTMKRASRKLDSIVEGWIEEHRQRRIDHAQRDGGDFIDVLLSQAEKGALEFDQFTNDCVITSTAKTIFIGATDSTSISLTWALSLLMNHPQFIKWAQDELDQVVGSSRWVQGFDITNLTRIRAIVKETLRLYPAAPLSIPHEATHDCSISGYRIQKGTTLLVNLWKIQRDPQVWPNPNEFNPKRFLTGPLADANIGLGLHFELIPFGSGRRICPGSETAFEIMHLTIARLLQGFNFSTLDGKPVDMSEGPGITAPKAAPLEIVLTPRLSHTMYY